jgi:membrane fusion protein, multidrug efflux system
MRLSRQVLVLTLLSLAGAGAWYSLSPAPDAKRPAGSSTAGRPTAVVAALAQKGDITVNFDAVGSLRANEAVTVTSKQSGIIETVQFKEGEAVAAGAVLVQLDAGEVRAELAVAEANKRNTAQELNRSMALLGRQAVAQARVDDLRIELQAADARVNAARARLQDLTISAPFAGVAGLRHVSPGALVRPGEPVTTIDDLTVLKLDFTVPETALRALRNGLAIEASSTVFPGESFAGTVTAIDTRIDQSTRTLPVVATLPNPNLRLKPGMFLTVRLQLDTRRDVVLVPEEALVPVADRQFVYAVVDGKAVRRQVQIGARQGGMVEVTKGLAAGDSVIVRGTQKVRDGAPVQVEMEPPRPARSGSQS